MTLQPGKRFGRYELMQRIGFGGMAETWLARLLGEEGFAKPVLIKKVLPEYADDYAFTSMLISEARISAMLSHGNIAQTFDFGRVDNEFFLAMEYVDGQPLYDITQRTIQLGWPALPVAPAVFIGLEMCRALHYAHTRRDEAGKMLAIVHRDISPENVLVSYEGQVKIVDFGLAKARELRVTNTEPGVVKGKYLFFSPEQARGEEVDARTDVWATGIVMYEMLCGKLPVEGPEYIVLPKMGKGEFPRPRDINPRVPQELEDVVMGALAVRRQDRYPSCLVFGDALAVCLQSIAPRFSAMTLSYFVQEMFRDVLTKVGRPVDVPASFAEELESWRKPPRLSSPSEQAAPAESPARSRRANAPADSDKDRDDEQSVSTRVSDLKRLLKEEPVAPPAPAPEPPRGMWKWFVGGGTAVGWLGIGILFLVFMRRPVPEPVKVEHPVETATGTTPTVSPPPPVLRPKPVFSMEDHDRYIQEAKQALSSKRYQDAAANYRAALRINPDSMEAKDGLGFTLVLGGSGKSTDEEAAKLLQEVVDADAQNARAWFGLGMALQGLRREDQAIEAYKQYLKLDPVGRFSTDAHYALKQLGEN